MMLSTGIGAEVQRPLATVVVFGMACDTFLTMLALPVLYLLFGKGPEQVVESTAENQEGNGALAVAGQAASMECARTSDVGEDRYDQDG
jgi:AcrB/AcrD/AcrF family